MKRSEEKNFEKSICRQGIWDIFTILLFTFWDTNLYIHLRYWFVEDGYGHMDSKTPPYSLLEQIMSIYKLKIKHFYHIRPLIDLFKFG